MITFVTINCDDKQREWNFDSVDVLSKAYWTTCDIPSLDDPIVSCEFMGIPLYFGTFSDLITTFGVNNEEDYWKEDN